MEKGSSMSLNHKWLSFCKSNGFAEQDSENILTKHYIQNELAYHNLEHIADCLKEFEKHQKLAEDPIAVELAIWFHDAIYDPKAKDNEERSALMAQDFLSDSPLAKTVAELILDTKHQARPQTNDGQLICDIDMSILGREPAIYQRYSQAIRKEYSWVSNEDYSVGRRKVLDNFLAREHIYYLPVFVEKYEEQARSNLTFERGSL